MFSLTDYCNKFFRFSLIQKEENRCALLNKKQEAEISRQFLDKTATVFCQQLPFNSAKHFLAESRLYQQVFIRIKQIGLKWVMVLREIHPYKGKQEAHGLSVLTAAPTALHSPYPPIQPPPPPPQTHTHAHTFAAVSNNWYLTVSPAQTGVCLHLKQMDNDTYFCWNGK